MNHITVISHGYLENNALLKIQDIMQHSQCPNESLQSAFGEDVYMKNGVIYYGGANGDIRQVVEY